MIALIDSSREQIEKLCYDTKVKRLFVFGSILTDRFKNESDIDLLVEFENVDPLEYVDFYYNLKFGLEELLNREIDLLEIQAIKNPLMKLKLEEAKQLIYGVWLHSDVS